ncbi:MAG: hypothetical protein ACFB15_23210 [Cyclobacteriaceae bacterium]
MLFNLIQTVEQRSKDYEEVGMKDLLIEQIERRLKWGESAQWSNKDFQELSERIFSTTHKQLSVTTLKRLWGRAESTTQPSVATLDILSEFAGYKNWRHFRQSHEPDLPQHNTVPSRWARRSKRRIVGLIGLIVLSSSIWYVIDHSATKTSSPPSSTLLDSIEFSFQKVATGYPNTVIFRYDVGDIPYDTLCIQQSWDTNKRIFLSESQGLVTTTYYYPGYFLTKLLVNSQIIQEKELYIPTQGWQGILLESADDFTYLKPNQIQTDSTLTVATEVLQQADQNPKSILYLANLSDNPQISSTNFSLETEFRLAQPTEGSICQNVRLTITGTKEVLGFHFSIPGCVGDLIFMLNKEMISGKDHDLSAFGLDLKMWTNCKVDVKDNLMVVSLNNQEVFRHQLASNIGSIGGVQWTFEGLGEIRQLRLQDDVESLDLMK